MRSFFIYIAIIVTMSGCFSDYLFESDSIAALDPDDPPITSGNWYKPAPLITWQWQLSGMVNTSYDVTVYDIDLFDSPESLIQCGFFI